MSIGGGGWMNMKVELMENVPYVSETNKELVQFVVNFIENLRPDEDRELAAERLLINISIYLVLCEKGHN